MDSKKIPVMSIPSEQLKCSNIDHTVANIEFVCTKLDCTKRLACAECILGDHTDHFSWMKIIEDFFGKNHTDKVQGKSDDIQNFLKESESYLSNFEIKLIKEKEARLSEIHAIKDNFIKSCENLEKRIEIEVDNYRKTFSENLKQFKNLIEDSQASFPEKIEDTESLLAYLEYTISKDNELRNKKATHMMRKIKEYLSSVCLIQFDSKSINQYVNNLESNLTFFTQLEVIDVFKKQINQIESAFDPSKLTSFRTLQTTHKKSVYSLALLDYETKIATCSDDHTIHVYDLKTGELLNNFTGHTERVWSLLPLTQGKLASCSGDNTIRIWDLDKKICEKILEGHTALVSCIIELPNNNLISGSHDKSIRFWDLNVEASKALKRTVINTNMNKVMAILFLSNVEIAYTSDNSIHIAEYDSFTIKKTLGGHHLLVRDLLHIPERKILVSGSDDKTIKLWSLDNGKIFKTLNGHSQTVTRIMLFKKGVFVSSSDDGSIKFWDEDSGNCINTLTGHESWVINLSMLFDGTLISTGADKTIRFWSDSSN